MIKFSKLIETNTWLTTTTINNNNDNNNNNNNLNRETNPSGSHWNKPQEAEKDTRKTERINSVQNHSTYEIS